LEDYFHKKKDTIHRAIIKMIKENSEKIFKYNTNEGIVVTKEGLEYLCKNYFKQKYLELLEKYKKLILEMRQFMKE